jgi:multiple sugar transport system substrate-binding protein
LAIRLKRELQPSAKLFSSIKSARISSFQDPELVKKYAYYPAILDGMNNSIEYPPVKEAEDIHILVYNQVNAAVSGDKSAIQAAHDLQQTVLDLLTKRGYYQKK